MGKLNKNNRDQKQAFLLISAEVSYLTKETCKERTNSLKEMLNTLNLSYKQVVGHYYGSAEISFMVPVDSKLAAEIITERMFNRFEQESTLYVDAKRNAELWFDGHNQSIGKFHATPPALAKQCQSYTQDGDNYYTCY